MADQSAADIARKYGAEPVEMKPDSLVIPTAPPPGFGRQIYRGVAQTMGAIDQLGANLAGMLAKIPNTPHFKQAADAAQAEADRRQKEIDDIDAAEAADPSSTAARITGKTVGAIGSAAPYLATDGPIGAGVVGAMQNADQGIGPMARGFVMGAIGQKVGAGAGRVASKMIPANSVSTVANVGKNMASGAVSGAASSAVMSALPGGEGGTLEDTAANALAGAAMGGVSNRGRRTASGKPKGPVDPNQQAADWLQAATGLTGSKTQHPAVESFLRVFEPMVKTAKNMGLDPKAMTLKDLQEVVKQTGADYEAEFQKYLDPIRDQVVDTRPISDAIADAIKSIHRDGDFADSKAFGDEMQKFADEYRTWPGGVEDGLPFAGSGKQLTVGKLNERREDLFRLRRKGSADDVDKRTNAEKAAGDIAEAKIKDILYELANQQAAKAGKGPGYVRDVLKTNQHHLIGLDDALIQAIKDKTEAASIKRGTPFVQKGNITIAAHPSGSLVGSLHGLMGLAFGDPASLESANKRVRDAFASADSMPSTATPPGAQSMGAWGNDLAAFVSKWKAANPQSGTPAARWSTDLANAVTKWANTRPDRTPGMVDAALRYATAQQPRDLRAPAALGASQSTRRQKIQPPGLASTPQEIQDFFGVAPSTQRPPAIASPEDAARQLGVQ
jgi:hypothetical protein